MEQNILADVEQELYLERASLGKRFANLIIDTIGFYVFVLAVGFAIGLTNAAAAEAFADDENAPLQLLISFSCYLAYFTLAEGLTKGRSLGKFITGTVAVKADGSPITWKDALMRSLSRLVPFEPFSAFGVAPWHDSWTKTTVIKKVK